MQVEYLRVGEEVEVEADTAILTLLLCKVKDRVEVVAMMDRGKDSVQIMVAVELCALIGDLFGMDA